MCIRRISTDTKDSIQLLRTQKCLQIVLQSLEENISADTRKVLGIDCRFYIKNAGLCQKNNLQLNGYAYEAGLNDFVISDEEDYITKIMIKIDEIS